MKHLSFISFFFLQDGTLSVGDNRSATNWLHEISHNAPARFKDAFVRL